MPSSRVPHRRRPLTVENGLVYPDQPLSPWRQGAQRHHPYAAPGTPPQHPVRNFRHVDTRAKLQEPLTRIQEPLTRIQEPLTRLQEPLSRLQEPLIRLQEPLTRPIDKLTRRVETMMMEDSPSRREIEYGWLDEEPASEQQIAAEADPQQPHFYPPSQEAPHTPPLPSQEAPHPASFPSQEADYPPPTNYPPPPTSQEADYPPPANYPPHPTSQDVRLVSGQHLQRQGIARQPLQSLHNNNNRPDPYISDTGALPRFIKSSMKQGTTDAYCSDFGGMRRQPKLTMKPPGLDAYTSDNSAIRRFPKTAFASQKLDAYTSDTGAMRRPAAGNPRNLPPSNVYCPVYRDQENVAPRARNAYESDTGAMRRQKTKSQDPYNGRIRILRAYNREPSPGLALDRKPAPKEQAPARQQSDSKLTSTTSGYSTMVSVYATLPARIKNNKH